MTLSLRDGLDPCSDDLRPITRVMYASALIPGGQCIFSDPAQHMN